MASINVIGVVLMMLMVAAAATEKNLSCTEIKKELSPCLKYLRNKGEERPSSDCCNAVKRIHRAATTTEARKSDCVCLKNLLKEDKTIDPSRAAALPRYCSVNVLYEISKDTDCSKVR